MAAMVYRRRRALLVEGDGDGPPLAVQWNEFLTPVEALKIVRGL